MTPENPSEIKFVYTVGNQRFRYPAQTWFSGPFQFFKFDYNKFIIEEIKMMKGARWNPDMKCWYIPAKEARNQFQLHFLMGLNPYARYDVEADESWVPKTRVHRHKGEIKLFKHQPNMVAEMYTRHYKIIAGEMGTSKTLSAIIFMERAQEDYWKKYGAKPDIWYVAPRSGLSAVERELWLWQAQVGPDLMTYESLTKRMKAWEVGKKAPYIIIFDEASKAKNENSQRAQAAKALADGVRHDWGYHANCVSAVQADWGNEGYVIEMSGSPAPKSPADWYSQAEIACPGFIKEGDINKFKRRLAIIVQKESMDGGVYPQLLSWKDDEKKCNICGKYADDFVHTDPTLTVEGFHTFCPSVNEVKLLYERLKGLVSVYFKKDCLDLPDKTYRVIELKPKPSMIRTAKAIAATAPTSIQALTLLRELSDGFQYVETPDGTQECSLCHGAKSIEQPREIPNSCPNCQQGGAESIRSDKFDIGEGVHVCGDHRPQTVMEMLSCPNCGGSGEVKKFRREVTEVPCPKDDVLSDLLDELEDIGRLVIFAGFTAAIDRCVRICCRAGWHVIRMDQGTVKIIDHQGKMVDMKDFQSMFQDQKVSFPKVAFVAHPKSGGMGLTLTASPKVFYFSNTFDAEDRIQSEDRIHRAGMDYNLGAEIIDAVHLPSDQKILDNLKAKRDLQLLTLGDVKAAMDDADSERKT